MSILTTDIIAYACAVPPAFDGTGDTTVNIGGGIDTTRRILFNTVLTGGNSAVKIRSSGADTRFTRITGRKVDGTLVTENLQFNGVTPVSSANNFERIIRFEVYDSSNTTPTGSATLTANLFENDNSTLIGAVGGTAATSTEVGFMGFFCGSSSDPATTKTRYEKFFYKNTNATLALQGGTIQLTADASTVLSIAVENTVNDTHTVSNRLTAPAGGNLVGGAFSTSAISIPGASLAAGAAIGVWVKQALLTANAAIDLSYQTTILGQST